MTDRRIRPPELQDAAGTPGCISSDAAFLHAAPNGARDRQLVHGDPVTILSRHDGWAFVEAQKDGYCGHLPETALTDAVSASHVVRSRQTHLYGTADMKQPPLMRLPFAARVTVEDLDGRWARVTGAGSEGYVHRAHLRALTEPEDDPIDVATRFLGTPYLWAGNTGDGIDCSGLVQGAMLACGIPCPGDSDQQAAALGDPVPLDADVRRGDLFFWAGHVALAVGDGRILHATAYTMSVIFEPLAEAIDRITAQGEGPVTARRRVR